MKQTLKQTKRQSRSLQLPDLRTLPAALKNIPRRTVIVWIMTSVLGLVLLPVTLLASSLSDEVNTLKADVDNAIAAQTSMPTLQPVVQSLFKQLDKTQAQANEIQAVAPTLAAGKLDLPGVMSVIGNYDPDQIALDGLERNAQALTVSGHAADNGAVIAYVNALQESGLFKSVVLQSVQIQDPQVITMTVAPGSILPTATMTPTLTVTPTPSLTDLFEPDDAQPPPLNLGQPQTHTFYPNGDVDRVSFLAKAGRYYKVDTVNLALGVDTSITVEIGGLIYTNDDFKMGALYSEVIFAAPGQDTIATITITNRGQFGITQNYDLTIEEVSATATPTATAAATALASGTGTAGGTSGSSTQAAPTTVTVPTTAVPSTATNTPTLTNTPIPTTAVPPTFTNTPTPTNTTVPPTLTPTFTLEPPTVEPSPTNTLTPVPPTEVPTVPPPTFGIVNASIAVSPQTGPTCPGTFTFSGSVTAMGAGSADFVFERSDGTTSPAQTISFGGDGTFAVADTWTIPGAPGFNFAGWERIRILTPNSLVSNAAEFLLVCPPEVIATPSAHNQKMGPYLPAISMQVQNSFSMLGSAVSIAWLEAAQSLPEMLDRISDRTLKGGTPGEAQDAPGTFSSKPIRFVLVVELKAGVR